MTAVYIFLSLPSHVMCVAGLAAVAVLVMYGCGVCCIVRKS